VGEGRCGKVRIRAMKNVYIILVREVKVKWLLWPRRSSLEENRAATYKNITYENVVWSFVFSSEQGKAANCYKGTYKMSRSIKGGK